ncbi:MAG: DNA-directed RNA polymerase subunit omega [Clostridia bacterium]|nr:DNA-directed RNA polymerase subunit omega [Clostridia bacterium]
MLNPAIGKLINNTDNRYKLVNQIAQKARNLADEAEQKGEIIIEKPVTIAINKMADEIDG